MRQILRSAGFVLVLLLWYVSPTTAQEYGVLTGTVLDSAYNEPIAYASVQLENTIYVYQSTSE